MDFERTEAEVFRLYRAGDFAAAVALVSGDAQEPHEARFAFWRACLRARLGDPAGAIGELERAVAAGHWYGERSLADEDLGPLRADPLFGALAAVCDERARAAAAAPPPPLVSLPHPPATAPRAVVALHRAGGSPRRALPHWRPALDAGWLVVLPAAERVVDSETRVWLDGDDRAIDRAAAARVGAATARALADHAVAPEARVLAGFSQGAAVALGWALDGTLPAAAVLAIGSTLRYAEALEAAGAGRAAGLRAHFVVGGGERRVAETLATAERLRAAGGNVTVDLREHLGHAFPAAFDDELPALLAGLA